MNLSFNSSSVLFINRNMNVRVIYFSYFLRYVFENLLQHEREWQLIYSATRKFKHTGEIMCLTL